ncbi:hypothetical protein SAMN03092900_1616 [Thiomicrospira sp. ALE5]|nr:hypothetical protein SAMN03092900_1616 [Thiomicrospira sp. ALE5]
MNMKNLSRRQFIFGASALALLPAASWAHTHSHGGHGEGHHHGHSNHGGHGSHGNHGHQGHQHHPHMDHSEPNMISLNPRQRGAVIWHFDQPGTYYYGCLEPGHYEAGMIGKIIVSN